MERMMQVGYPPSVGKFRPDQIATRRTWATVPDAQMTLAAVHVIHVVPAAATTVTHLNPMDPGTTSDGTDGQARRWNRRPGDIGRLHPTRFPR